MPFFLISRNTVLEKKSQNESRTSAFIIWAESQLGSQATKAARVRDTGSGEPGSRPLFGSGSGSSSLFWPLQWYLSASNPIQREPNQYNGINFLQGLQTRLNNQRWCMRRPQTIANYLLSLHIPADKLQVATLVDILKKYLKIPQGSWT